MPGYKFGNNYVCKKYNCLHFSFTKMQTESKPIKIAKLEKTTFVKNIVTRRGLCVTYRRLLDWIYWYLVHSTRNYKQLQRYRYSHTLQATVTHTSVFSLLHSPLVVSWQRIHNTLTIISNHT
jgi:hypothetical protein